MTTPAIRTVFVPTRVDSADDGFTTHHARVDGSALAAEVERVGRELAAGGLEVVSVVPVSSGQYGRARDGAYGFSYTSGVLITARAAG